MDGSIANSRTKAMVQAVVGASLMVGFWWIAWTHKTELRFHTFFPLWFGYILLADAVVLWVSSTSLLRRLGRRVVLLFLISMPFWWAFEAANARLNNWVYRLPHEYSWFEYHAEASLAFSTVVPAVFVSAEAVHLFLHGPFHWLRLNPDPMMRAWIGGAGVLMITLALLWPDPFFPLIWIGAFLAADGVAYRLGARSISRHVASGDWTVVVVLFTAALWCGFLWEMWNSRSIPSWTYELPYAEWARLFEMPVLGFGGYLPFGLCLYAATMVLERLCGSPISPSVSFDRVASDRATKQ
jgi:hypothetical protein